MGMEVAIPTTDKSPCANCSKLGPRLGFTEWLFTTCFTRSMYEFFTFFYTNQWIDQVHFLDDETYSYNGTWHLAQDTLLTHHLGDEGVHLDHDSFSSHPPGGQWHLHIGQNAPSTRYRKDSKIDSKKTLQSGESSAENRVWAALLRCPSPHNECRGCSVQMGAWFCKGQSLVFWWRLSGSLPSFITTWASSFAAPIKITVSGQ